MVTTLGSKGYIPLVANNNTYVTVLTVPTGYHCKINYFLAQHLVQLLLMLGGLMGLTTDS
jgi:hypothetical protein